MNVDAGTVAVIAGGLNLVITVGGGGYFMGVLTGKIKRIEEDISETKILLVSSAVAADRLKRAEADISNIEHDLRNLRKGVGWIKDENARTVEREY